MNESKVAYRNKLSYFACRLVWASVIACMTFYSQASCATSSWDGAGVHISKEVTPPRIFFSLSWGALQCFCPQGVSTQVTPLPAPFAKWETLGKVQEDPEFQAKNGKGGTETGRENEGDRGSGRARLGIFVQGLPEFLATPLTSSSAFSAECRRL